MYTIGCFNRHPCGSYVYIQEQSHTSGHLRVQVIVLTASESIPSNTISSFWLPCETNSMFSQPIHLLLCTICSHETLKNNTTKVTRCVIQSLSSPYLIPYTKFLMKPCGTVCNYDKGIVHSDYDLVLIDIMP